MRSRGVVLAGVGNSTFRLNANFEERCASNLLYVRSARHRVGLSELPSRLGHGRRVQQWNDTGYGVE